MERCLRFDVASKSTSLLGSSQVPSCESKSGDWQALFLALCTMSNFVQLLRSQGRESSLAAKPPHLPGFFEFPCPVPGNALCKQLRMLVVLALGLGGSSYMGICLGTGKVGHTLIK